MTFVQRMAIVHRTTFVQRTTARHFAAATMDKEMTMPERQVLEREQRVLRWSGLAGVLGSIVMIAVFVIVGVFVGGAAVEPRDALIRFPDIRAARTVENGLYLVVLALWAIHLLGLYRAVRTSLAPALIGGALGMLGLTVLAAGALPHVATLPVSALYHAPGATPADQATLLLIWRAAQGIFDAMLFAGLALLPVGLIAFGAAMAGTAAFGKRFGLLSIGLGLIGVVAATLVVIDPASPIAALGFFTLIAFHLVIGWKTYRLSSLDWIVGDRTAAAAPVGAARVALGER